MTYDLGPGKRQELYERHLQQIAGIGFTLRQVDVIACLIHKRNQAKIAELLSIPSVRTVQTHVQDIKDRSSKFSVEHIIDMVDKSGKRKLIEEYYFNILVQSSFKQALQKIKIMINRGGGSCSVDSKATEEEIKLLKQIKQDLGLANIILVDDKSKFGQVLKNLCFINTSIKITQDKKNGTEPNNDILIFFDTKNNLSVLEGLEYIDFKDSSTYYFSLLALISKILEKPNIEQIIQEFKDEYDSLQKSWQSTGAGSIEPVKSSGIENFCKQNKAVIGVISVVSAALMAYAFTYIKNNNNSQIKLDTIENSIGNQVNKEAIKKTKVTKSKKIYNDKDHLAPKYLPISSTFTYEKKETFLEKKGIFEQLDKILAHNQYVVITGAPGVGKSSCVSEYARSLISSSKDYKIIVRSFIASSNTNIYNEYLKIAKEYDEPGLNNLSKEIIIQKVHSYLASNGEVIFIFDNVENYKDIIEYIKNLPPNIKLIITSRNDILSENLSNKYQVKLEAFNQEESVNYLKKILSARINAGQVSETKLKELIEELGGKTGCMVYKLARAAAWFKDQQLASIDDYIEKHRKGEEDEIETTLLFDLLKESPAAWKIMQYASYLDPDFISMQLLSKLLNISKDSLNEHIIKLQSLSLVDFVRRPGDNGIKLHRLTQEMIPKYIARHQHSKLVYTPKVEILSSLINTLDELMPVVTGNPDETWMIANNLYGSIAQVASLLNLKDNAAKFDNLPEKLAVANIYNKLGTYHQNVTYNYKAALECYKSAEDIYVKLGDNLKRAELLVSRGRCYFAMRKLDESLANFEEAINLFDKDTLNIIKADALGGRGIIYDKKGIDSLKSHLDAYEMYKKLYFGRDHPKIATALHNIGWYYRESEKIKDLKEALKYFQESLAMRRRLYPNQYHCDVASSINGIGTVYTKMGGKDNLKKALDYQKQVLQMRMELFQGQISQDIINSYFRLGETYKELENHAKSLDFFAKARSGVYEIHNTYNYGTIIGAFRNAAEIYEQSGNIAEAIEYYKKGYSIIKWYHNHSTDENKKLIEKVNRKLIDKTKELAPEFIHDSESRLFIIKYGGLDEETYNIKIKLREILKKLHSCSKKGQWKESWFSNGASKYASDKQIQQILKGGSAQNITKKELEIAKALCFEAINIGIMSNPEPERDFNCMIRFAKENSELVRKIAKEHSEYFVDGTLMIKCAEEGIIPFELAIKAIGEKEYEEYRAVAGSKIK